MNLAELNILLEKSFECVVGPPRAYFEIATPADCNFPVVRIIYDSVIRAVRSDSDEAENLLCSWAATRLVAKITREQLLDRSVLLFWRTKPRIEGFTDANGRNCLRIMMRLAIPGVDLSDLAVAQGAMPPWL